MANYSAKTKKLFEILAPSESQDKFDCDSQAGEDLNIRKLLRSYEYEKIKPKKDDLNKLEKIKSLSSVINKRKNSKHAFIKKSDYKIKYEEELNKEQLAAVSIVSSPLLAIAGAGSGKTRVIVYKVAYLVENGVHPSEILLLTFTRKAANEMLDRVKNLLKKKTGRGVIGGTFHSFANHALRKYGKLAGIASNFTIMDTSDAEDAISMLRNELNFEKKKKNFPRKDVVQKIISRARNMQISVPKAVKRYLPNYKDFAKELKKLSEIFQQYKREHNILDYDDLMDVLRDSLRDNDSFRKMIHSKIKYILVDEYQDTNSVQGEIVELLVGNRKNITVVGDDSQSIYSFRGANYENILKFPSLFSHCKLVRIEQNYRSGKEILDFTNGIISNAQLGFKKKLYTKRLVGRKPVLKMFSDATAEGEFVADSILHLQRNNLEYSDFSVLVRSIRHSDYIQTEFAKNGVPFVVVGGIKFSERRHVRDVLSFLKILLNPIDVVAWHRVLELIGGIGKVRASEIVQVVKSNGGAVEFSSFSDKSYYKQIKKYEKFYRKADSETLPDQAVKMVTIFYRDLLKQVEPDYEDRLKDLKVLVTVASKYNSIEKFLTDFVLEPPSNRWQDQDQPTIKDNEKAVTISTIHSAKGLEWHTVFIPHALDGLIPSHRSLNSLEKVEEERRVFYVATTRAKENLFITMPVYVPPYDVFFTQPSRFIKEIDERCYKVDE